MAKSTKVYFLMWREFPCYKGGMAIQGPGVNYMEADCWFSEAELREANKEFTLNGVGNFWIYEVEV